MASTTPAPAESLVSARAVHKHYGAVRAVDGVDLEVRPGELFGLIGHNGAGKTTLLRVLNGLIKPDQGRVAMRGRIGALIALGAGFNPILTGRENVYVNAAVLGMHKSLVDQRFDEIVAFAEIADFIDAPVRTYSSGMRVRLGFAVAAVLLEPDILFLDEVLAVGDISFIVKCLNTVRRMTNNAAVVFVSHNMQYVSSFCTRVMVMDHGKVRLDTEQVAEAVDEYHSLLAEQKTVAAGAGGAEVLGLDLLLEGMPTQGREPVFSHGNAATALLRVRIDATEEEAELTLNVQDESMSSVVSCPVQADESTRLRLPRGEHLLRIPLWPFDLNRGRYSFVVVVHGATSRTTWARLQGVRPFRVATAGTHWGKLVRPVVALPVDAKARQSLVLPVT